MYMYVSFHIIIQDNKIVKSVVTKKKPNKKKAKQKKPNTQVKTNKHTNKQTNKQTNTQVKTNKVRTPLPKTNKKRWECIDYTLPYTCQPLPVSVSINVNECWGGK